MPRYGSELEPFDEIDDVRSSDKKKRQSDISLEEMRQDARELSAAAAMNMAKRRKIERDSVDEVGDLTGEVAHGVIDLTKESGL
jgi:hypothetical protein